MNNLLFILASKNSKLNGRSIIFKAFGWFCSRLRHRCSVNDENIDFILRSFFSCCSPQKLIMWNTSLFFQATAIDFFPRLLWSSFAADIAQISGTLYRQPLWTNYVLSDAPSSFLIYWANFCVKTYRMTTPLTATWWVLLDDSKLHWRANSQKLWKLKEQKSPYSIPE